MATLTGSYAAAGVPPRVVHNGLFTVVFSYDNGIAAAAASTISAGDTILMGKVATGVTIIDGYVIQTLGDTGSISVGIESETNLIASGSTSAGAAIRFLTSTGAILPYTASVSDDATVRFQTIRIGVDADYTTTTQFKVVLFCTADV